MTGILAFGASDPVVENFNRNLTTPKTPAVHIIRDNIKEPEAVSNHQNVEKESLTAHVDALLYHIRTIWLFTRSDIKTIIGPKSVFGTMNAIAASTFGIPTSQSPAQILSRFPLVVLWVWINLLPFNIDNQRRPTAILEDNINKPWRPMPSKRISPQNAKRIMLSLIPMAVLASLRLGGFRQCAVLILLGYWYNELGGADSSFYTRNFINACGFICYSSGAMEVALGSSLVFPARLSLYFLLIGWVVFTTVSLQDMYDQEGDSLRGRKTLPLVMGDDLARTITAFPMAFWSVFGPWFWKSPAWIYALSMGMGFNIIFRMLIKRSVRDDKRTLQLWILWLVTFYSTPLVKHFTAVGT